MSYEWDNINKYHCENETNNVEYLHDYVFNICAFGQKCIFNDIPMECLWNKCIINTIKINTKKCSHSSLLITFTRSWKNMCNKSYYLNLGKL